MREESPEQTRDPLIWAYPLIRAKLQSWAYLLVAIVSGAFTYGTEAIRWYHPVFPAVAWYLTRGAARRYYDVAIDTCLLTMPAEELAKHVGIDPNTANTFIRHRKKDLRQTSTRWMMFRETFEQPRGFWEWISICIAETGFLLTLLALILWSVAGIISTLQFTGIWILSIAVSWIGSAVKRQSTFDRAFDRWTAGLLVAIRANPELQSKLSADFPEGVAIEEIARDEVLRLLHMEINPDHVNWNGALDQARQHEG